MERKRELENAAYMSAYIYDQAHAQCSCRYSSYRHRARERESGKRRGEEMGSGDEIGEGKDVMNGINDFGARGASLHTSEC